MKKIAVFIFILFTLALSSCLPQNVRVPQSPLLSTLERKSGMIAYVGIDGNVYVSDQGGGKLQKLTEDALVPQTQGDPSRTYQFLSWAHDGNQVAFTKLASQGSEITSGLIVANINEKSQQEIYTSQNEHPFYLYWSPDNKNISFLSTTSAGGQNILLQSAPAAGGERTLLDTGSPYYWSWAPNGQVMIVHSGSDTSTSPDHLSFLKLDSNVQEDRLDEVPASFQAPAWSPDGSHIALGLLSNDQKQVVITDSAGENPKVIGTFTSKTAMAWSRDGKKLAYIDGSQAMTAGTIGALHVYDMDTQKEVIEDRNVATFFWSPNGEEIAYFILAQASDTGNGSSNATPAAPQYVVGLSVFNVTTGENRDIFTYRPTDQFLNIIPYFDQYSQSVTIWSPDNNNLVLSYIDSTGKPGVAVVAASGQLEPRILTNGYIAFWSWK